MSERPILFSAPMFCALLEGRKTQTRRVVKPQPWGIIGGLPTRKENGMPINCPYGKPGDRLWVRETWAADISYDSYPPRDLTHHVEQLWFAAGGGREFECNERGRVRSSMFMPRWASRITLEVTEVRVQRLQEISEADAIDEGLIRYNAGPFVAWKPYEAYEGGIAPIAAYSALWQSINGTGSWDANPWVWAVSFKVVPHG